MRSRVRACMTMLVACGALLSQATCSDIRLEFPEKEQDLTSVDDELRIQGEFCTSPSANVVYPVKIMFIVDGSGSQQFTDQNRQRVVAVTETIQRLIGSGNTYFKIIVFNASVESRPRIVEDQPVFTNDLSAIQEGLDIIASADTLTDYQGALAVVYSELVRDMESVRNDPLRGFAELGRSKYLMVFMSDGFPDPQCKVGLGNDFDVLADDGINALCEDADYLACVMQAGTCDDGSLCREDADCVSGGACTDLPDCATDANGDYVCISADGETLCYAPVDSSNLFGGLDNIELLAGNDYNQPYQILKSVQDIMDLEERYQVGEMRMDAALVLDPLASDEIIALLGDATQAIPLMQQIAEIGKGDYLEFYGGDSIDFGSLNFDSLKQTRVVRSFFVQARSLRLTEDDQSIDTDFDGLTDNEEYDEDVGTDPLLNDSDGDGYNDYLENRRKSYGFDARDPCLPAIVDMSRGGDATLCDEDVPSTYVNCDHEGFGAGAVYFDDDFDGLNNCEERAIGSDPRLPDTDADGLIDRVDYEAGLSAVEWDYDRDVDQDGVPNGREIEWHLNPLVFQSDVESREHYRYVRNEIEGTIDGRSCYAYDVRHVRLGATGSNQDLTPITYGMNEVRLYILENMSDNLSGVPLVRVACIRPRYIEDSLKVPATGQVTIEEDAFKYLATQDPIANELDETEYFSPTDHCQVLQ